MRPDELGERDDLEKTEDTWHRVNIRMNRSPRDSPKAAICSLVRTGWKPTNGTCILAKVPIAYQDEYAVYRRLLNRPIRISVNACNGIMFVMNAYPPKTNRMNSVKRLSGVSTHPTRQPCRSRRVR